MTQNSRPWYLRLTRNKASEMWQRCLPLWHVAVFGQLAVAFILMVTDEEATMYPPTIWSFLHIAFIVWYSIAVLYTPEWWRKRQTLFGVYILFGGAIWWMLVSGSNVYFLLLSGLFPFMFFYLDFRNAMIGTVGLNTLVLLRLNQIMPQFVATWLILILITSASGIILGYFIDAIIKQSMERRHLIEELQATREQLAHAERLAGIAHERQRLAADLHDTLIQSLISVVTHLEAAENAPEQLTSHLQIAKQAARDSLQDARQAIWDLRLPSDHTGVFHETIRQICHQWKTRSNLPIEFTQAGDAFNLSEEIQHVMLRILQESLANISRHASATKVFVTLKYTDDCIKLFVTDDGIGFDPKALETQGHGIENMCQRAKSLGGDLLIESQVGQGSTITVHLPVQITVKRAQDVD